MASDLTADEARRLFFYDETTGALIRKVSAGRSRAGDEAGYLHSSGYRKVHVCGLLMSSHLVIWLMKTGERPKLTVDHIDRNPLNNRWENLRLATRSQQQGNTKVAVSNSSGVRGVVRSGKRWVAVIWKNGAQKYLGTFDMIDAAKTAYDRAAIEQFGEFYQP